jgi:hypothetical protein
MGLRTSLDEFSETEAAELKRQMIFGGAAANKRLAPVFGKTFKIPMIDDGKMATEHNPGVAGILAPYFEPHPFSGEDLEKINAGRLILEQVVEEVKKIKKSIATPRPIPRP